MASLISKSETGLYSSAWRIAIIVNFAAISLGKVWQPLIFKLLASDNNQNDLKIVKGTYLYMLLLILIGLIIIVSSDFIVKLALAPTYHSATIYVRFLVIAITLQSLFAGMADFLMFHKAIKVLTMISISGVIIQYLLIFVFYYFDQLSVMNIIYSIIVAGLYTIIHAWSFVVKSRERPWLFFMKNSFKFK